MIGITIQKHVRAPREAVFDAATDFARCPEFIEGITRVEMLTDGPVRVGTRFRETRKMFGREAAEEMAITELDRPAGYVLGCENHGCRYRSRFTFTPKGPGTDVTMSFEAEPLTLVAKVLSFLFRPMMKSMAKECLKDLDDLAAHVEARAKSA